MIYVSFALLESPATLPSKSSSVVHSFMLKDVGDDSFSPVFFGFKSFKD